MMMAFENLEKLNPFPVHISEKWSFILLSGASAVVTYGIITLGQKLCSRTKSKSSSSASSPKLDEAQLELEPVADPMTPHDPDFEERKPSRLWNTAMFFPDYNASEPDSTTQQFLWYFAQARVSIRICIYNFSFPELESVIKQQYRRGLIVEVIAGHEMTAQALRRNEIPTGLMPRREGIAATDQIMHHKFAVIDDEAVLTGSMNWTTEAIINNKENVMVTTNPNMVKQYIEGFFMLKKICENARQFY